jgi:uncharacterized protein YlxW (UPF0749 family)
MTADERPEGTAPDGPDDEAGPDRPVEETAPDAGSEGPGVEDVEDVEDDTVERVTGDDRGEPSGPAPAVASRPRRRRDPLASVLIGVLTLLLGFAFMVQVRAADDAELLAGAREEDLVRILDELSAREERLRDQITDQRAALQQLTSSDSQAAAALEEATRRAEAIGILNGTVVARGPGLEMIIRDPEDAVRVADLLDVIQELRGAGAETMQIDGVRIGVSSAVTGSPGSLMIDGHPISAPYEVLVIGSPQNMETAMNIPGGVVQDVTRLAGSVLITQSQDVVVDALRPLDTPQYAAPDTDD